MYEIGSIDSQNFHKTMSKLDRKNRKERNKFLDCYALKHSEKGHSAVLQKRRKKITLKLPDGVDEAIQMVNQGFSLVEIV